MGGGGVRPVPLELIVSVSRDLMRQVSGDSVYLLKENHGAPDNQFAPRRDSGSADVNRCRICLPNYSRLLSEAYGWGVERHSVLGLVIHSNCLFR